MAQETMEVEEVLRLSRRPSQSPTNNSGGAASGSQMRVAPEPYGADSSKDDMSAPPTDPGNSQHGPPEMRARIASQAMILDDEATEHRMAKHAGLDVSSDVSNRKHRKHLPLKKRLKRWVKQKGEGPLRPHGFDPRGYV